ncbi:MAG: DUF512 domain-containing protein [Solirubrobacterales bacterium]
MHKGAVVAAVEPDSIADEVGIEAGDVLLSVNGHPLFDILDYRYQIAEDTLEMEVAKANGEIWVVDIEKDVAEDLGIEFEELVFDGIRPCINRCQFCFVDQMPPGLRDTLYVKDDDFRMSFVCGNFITLNNLGPRDWKKIAEMRLSPLYISVHATNPSVRARMLGMPRDQVLTDLARLRDAGIEIHTQIVLCPGINDRDVLQETVFALRSFWPSVQSVGIVPVGLTGHRKNLPALREVSPGEAATLLDLVEGWQKKFYRELGIHFVYLADEFYLKAGRAFPKAETYDDFVQIENGIGLARRFLDEVRSAADACGKSAGDAPVIVCGMSAEPILRAAVKMLGEAGSHCAVVPVANRLFGESVTVTGLLTGRDIMAALGDHFKGRRVLLPAVTLRHGQNIFLDDMTVDQLAEATGTQIEVVEIDGAELVAAVCGQTVQLVEDNEL